LLLFLFCSILLFFIFIPIFEPWALFLFFVRAWSSSLFFVLFFDFVRASSTLIWRFLPDLHSHTVGWAAEGGLAKNLLGGISIHFVTGGR
jgi:hypothetical protein